MSASRYYRLTLLFFFLATCGWSAADDLKASVSPCGLTARAAAGLSGDASIDVHAVPTYKKTMAGLLREGKFKQLDCLADKARASKEIFSGGTWKLHTLYVGLEEPPGHATPKDWQTHIGLLKRWVSARPGSITAPVALAESYVNYAWDARGHGYADTVSENGWKLFKERAAEGRRTLKEESGLRNKCPEWYVAMQDVALAQDWDPQAKRALLEEAVKFEPDYFYYYRKYAVSILPEWDGKQGQVEQFLQQTADHIGGDAGDILYFHVASLLVCCEVNQTLRFSWPRIQRGFNALEKQCGAAPENWNLLARMAAIYNDLVVANKMLSRIGDQWSEEVWKTPSYFQAVSDWAKQVNPMINAMMNAKTPAEQSADANLQTAEGQRYKIAFDEKIRFLLPDCKQESADPGDFKLLFRIGKDGTVNQVVTVGSNRIAPCLGRKVSGPGRGGQTAFPPPPTPDYWVRVDPNLVDSASTKK